jgi:hypothetical protein
LAACRSPLPITHLQTPAGVTHCDVTALSAHVAVSFIMDDAGIITGAP